MSGPQLGPGSEERDALRRRISLAEQERASAEEALVATQQWFRSIADFLPVGILVLTETLAVDYANARLLSVLGLSDLATRTWVELFHPDDHATVRFLVARARSGFPADSRRVRIRREHRDDGWASVGVTRVSGVDGELVFVCSVEDVTDLMRERLEREQTETRLRTAERLESLGQLSAGIAHDFNNVLAVVTACAELLTDAIQRGAAGGSPDWDQITEDVVAISAAADRASDLTRRLLVFARSADANAEDIDVNCALRDTVQLLRRTLGGHIWFGVAFGRGLGMVRIDRSQFEQIVVNLVINARDAIDGSGTITLGTDKVELGERDTTLRAHMKPGRYVRITVSDDGCGMEPDVVSRAFDPFFTTKAAGHGTGLGLATVYGIANRFGGDIAVQSERGVGTSMRVYLPVNETAQPAAGVATSPGTGAQAGDGRRVLLVEDDDDIRMIAERILSARGYHVAAVARGQEAIDHASTGAQIDVLLTDVAMPTMSGPQLVAVIHEVRPDIRVVYMSGYSGRHLAQWQLDEADAALVEKPFTAAALTAALERALS